MLLQSAELLRDSLKDTEGFGVARAKKPYDLVCWRSSLVVICGRKRISYNSEKQRWCSPKVGGRRGSSRACARSWRRKSGEWLDMEDAGHFCLLGGRLQALRRKGRGADDLLERQVEVLAAVERLDGGHPPCSTLAASGSSGSRSGRCGSATKTPSRSHVVRRTRRRGVVVGRHRRAQGLCEVRRVVSAQATLLLGDVSFPNIRRRAQNGRGNRSFAAHGPLRGGVLGLSVWDDAMGSYGKRASQIWGVDTNTELHGKVEAISAVVDRIPAPASIPALESTSRKSCKVGAWWP